MSITAMETIGDDMEEDVLSLEPAQNGDSNALHYNASQGRYVDIIYLDARVSLTVCC